MEAGGEAEDYGQEGDGEAAPDDALVGDVSTAGLVGCDEEEEQEEEEEVPSRANLP